MKRKIFCFRSAVIRSDFRRFWWIAALEFLCILLFTGIFLNYAHHALTIGDSSTSFYSSRLYRSMIPAVLFTLSFPAFAAVILFSYLNKSNSVSMLHGMPVTRTELFLSHTVSGLCIIAAPIIANALILLIALIDPNIASCSSVGYIMRWLLCMLLYSAVTFSFAALVSIITGNSIAAIVLSYIFALIPLFANAMFIIFMEGFMYGYTTGTEMFAAKYLYLFPSRLLTGYGITAYIILSAAFLAGAYLLYRIRGLENHGEIIAFKRLKTVFIYGVAVCVGICGFLYFIALRGDYDNNTSILSPATLLAMIPFGIIGLIIAQMIMRRSFRIRGIGRHILLYCALVIAFTIAVKLDITGFVTRVPDADDVSSVYVLSVPSQSGASYGQEIDPYNAEFTESEDIANVINMHKYFIENRDSRSRSDSRYTYMPIYYKLKSGRILQRRYPMIYDTDAAVLKPIYDTDIVKAARFSIIDGTEKNIQTVTVRDGRAVGDWQTNTEVGERLIAALQADIHNVRFEDYITDDEPITCIDISYTKQRVTQYGEYDWDSYRSESYRVRECYTNTIAVLQDIGLYDSYMGAENISAVNISRDIPYSASVDVTEDEIYFSVLPEGEKAATDEVSERNAVSVSGFGEVPSYDTMAAVDYYRLSDRESVELLYSRVFQNRTALRYIDGDCVYITFEVSSGGEIHSCVTPEEFEALKLS